MIRRNCIITRHKSCTQVHDYVPPKEREKLSDEKWQGNVIIAYRDKKHKMSFRTMKGERLINDAFLIRV